MPNIYRCYKEKKLEDLYLCMYLCMIYIYIYSWPFFLFPFFPHPSFGVLGGCPKAAEFPRGRVDEMFK